MDTAASHDPASTGSDRAREDSERLLLSLAHSASAAGGIVVLEGPAGAGRSALLRELARRMQGTRRPLLISATPEPGRGLAERILAAAGATGRGDPRRGVWRHVARAAVEGRPVVLLVDDADGLTAAALGALLDIVEHPASRASIVLASRRCAPLLAAMSSRGACVDLVRLDREEGARSDPWLALLHRRREPARGPAPALRRPLEAGADEDRPLEAAPPPAVSSGEAAEPQARTGPVSATPRLWTVEELLNTTGTTRPATTSAAAGAASVGRRPGRPGATIVVLPQPGAARRRHRVGRGPPATSPAQTLADGERSTPGRPVPIAREDATSEVRPAPALLRGILLALTLAAGLGFGIGLFQVLLTARVASRWLGAAL